MEDSGLGELRASLLVLGMIMGKLRVWKDLEHLYKTFDEKAKEILEEG